MPFKKGRSGNPGEPTVIDVNYPEKLPGKLKFIGGSMSDDWNNLVLGQTLNTLWLHISDTNEVVDEKRRAAVQALVGIAPRDELEGMLAAQLVACHNATMECYRRAMLGNQTFEGTRDSLNQANKLSRSYSTLLEALNRHRGKGTQKVTVEHVHVHEGGQAIVGTIEAPGGWVASKIGGTTPCTYTCTRHHDAEHEQGAGVCASHPR